MNYKAFLVEEIEGKFSTRIADLNTEHLPQGEVLIKVLYSSVNYKDALSVTGNKGVTKKYPHTPGIDAAGIIEASESEQFMPGDEVIITGYDLGMNTPGGFGEYIRVPAEWVVKLPEGLTLKESMIIGTAGFTSGISILRLTELVKPEYGEIVISGATGGVGSVALAILSQLGYQTVAISGKESEKEFLKSLGAKEIITRSDFLAIEDKPILSARFAGAIDTVGGDVLVKIIKSLKPLGAVTTCGSVSSVQLNNLNVFPFILRGITLIGISAQNYPTQLRKPLWEKLANEYKPLMLMNLFNEITINEIQRVIQQILKGQLKGRTIIKH